MCRIILGIQVCGGHSHRKDYAAKWRGDGRRIRLLGMNISADTRTIDAWRCE